MSALVAWLDFDPEFARPDFVTGATPFRFLVCPALR